jgi:ABC-type transport system involved in multi-copper enzyme maturation permease subunit
MIATFTIARNTMRETLRERLLYNLVLFGVVLVGASLTISSLTLGEQFRIIADIGTSTTQLVGTVISVFLGVAIIAREIDRRTAYAVLARPVSRGAFVTGKALGLLVVIALNVAVMAAVTALMLLVHARDPRFLGSGFVAAFWLMIVQFAVCVGFATFFACVTTPTLAVVLTLGCVLAGHLFAEVRGFWLSAKQVQMKQLVSLLDYVLPNMGLLDAKEALTYGDPVHLGSIVLRSAYGLGYAGVLLTLAALVFSRKDVR